MLCTLLFAGFCTLPAQDDWKLVGSRLLSPTDALARDVNGDGNLDIVIASDVDDQLVWTPGDGNRGFGPLQVIARGLAGPSRVDGADLDADGDLDWVVALDEGEDLMLVEAEGSASFAAPRSLDPASGAVTDVLLADVDADGDLDVVAALGTLGVVAWYDNDGGGLFGARRVMASLGGGLSDVDMVDLDGDGDLDLLWANQQSESAGWVVQSGPGAFDPPGTLVVGEPDLGQIVAADLEGDGSVEVLTSGRQLVLYLPQPGGGYVEQSRTGDSLTPVQATALEVVDRQQDGVLEAVAAFVGSVGRAYDYDPATSTLLPPIQLTGVNASGGLRVANMDADFRSDLICLGVQVTVAYGTGGNGWSAGSLESRIPTWVSTDSDGVFVDLDGDGDRDYLATASNGFGGLDSPDSVVLIERLAENQFGLPVKLPGQDFDAFYTPSAADLDGDGAVDICYLSLTQGQGPTGVDALWHRNLGGGQFADAAVLRRVGDGFTEFARGRWIDVDGDGDTDLLVDVSEQSDDGIRWYENDGTGQLGVERVVESVPRRRIRTVADFNGDGLMDYISVLNGPLRLRVTYGSTASATGFLLPEVLLADVRSFAQYAMDIDGDGDLDLASLYRDSELRFAWFENVQGALSGPIAVDTPGVAGFIPSAAGDLNGDGWQDVVMALPIQGEPTRVYFGTGAGFGAAVAGPIEDLDGLVTSFGVHDVNGDGDDDLLLELEFNNAGQLRAYETERELGVPVCPGQPNSVGPGAGLQVTGLDLVDRNQMFLSADQLPSASTVFFLTSRTTGFAAGAGGSQGDLCLGGAIGRFVGPGQVLQSSSDGRARLGIDLTGMPDPVLGLVAAVAGESWSFQGWYRDANPAVTSNFTEAQTVVLR